MTLEARAGYYFGAPDWLFDRSTFVIATRMGHAFPFNDIGDFDLGVQGSTVCDDPSNCTNAGNLDQLDDDVKLPLTERYFLGVSEVNNFAATRGLARSAARASPVDGPGDRAGLPPGGHGASEQPGDRAADRRLRRHQPVVAGQLRQPERGLQLGERQEYDDFDDIDEAQVIGGSAFISNSFEYRFPLSEIGLLGIGFIDEGNAFGEGEILFDATQWRYGYGGERVVVLPLWSPAARARIPDRPALRRVESDFEFSVGGLGI